MRKRQIGHSLRWAFLASLLVVVAASCEAGLGDPADRAAEHAELDSTELAVSQVVSASELRPGAKIGRQQLVQLFGERVAAAAGQSCSVLGAVCAPQAFAPTTPCGGFSTTCDSSGTQNGVFVDFICQNDGNNATCTPIAQTTIVTVGCSRVTNGTVCAAARCDTPFCLSYPNTCAEQTTQVQNCFSAAVCSNDVCGGQTVTQQAIGTCQRNTEGLRCAASCKPGFIGECTNGHCACFCQHC